MASIANVLSLSESWNLRAVQRNDPGSSFTCRTEGSEYFGVRCASPAVTAESAENNLLSVSDPIDEVITALTGN